MGVVPQEFHGHCLSAAHDAFFRRFKIVITGEMEPAMHQVEGEFRGELPLVPAGVAGRGVHGDANLARDAKRGIAFKRDHVGRRRIVEEVGVQLRERGIGEENKGKFAGRHL